MINGRCNKSRNRLEVHPLCSLGCRKTWRKRKGSVFVCVHAAVSAKTSKSQGALCCLKKVNSYLNKVGEIVAFFLACFYTYF